MNVVKRNTLFGYKVENGSIKIDSDEMAAVSEIYVLYTERGYSFNEIASLLNDKGILYSEGRPSWDKNKIARIIGDKRYIGDKGYTAMIDAGIFEKAISLRDKKQTVMNYMHSGDFNFIKLNIRIVCGDCGSKLRRWSDARCSVKERWGCTNTECRMSCVWYYGYGHERTHP